MIISVYLDTNILIQGSKLPEHIRLVDLSKQNKIALYHSLQNYIEMHKRSFLLGERKNAALALDRKLGPEMINNKGLVEKVIDHQNKTRKDYDDARLSEEQEEKFWAGAGIINAPSTFAGIAFSGFNYQMMQMIDVKHELQLLGDLMETYKIKEVDAIHLMYAHSAELDYFLTWDNLLIKKAKNVQWLNCTVCMPKEFLKKFS